MQKIWRVLLPVLAGLACIALFFPPRALAQAPTDDKLANLTINVWPEFDQPSVLVIYDGELASADKLPRPVTVLIPTGAQLNAAAYVDASGQDINTDAPTTKDNGDGFTLVTITVPTTKFHVEYYYNPLQGAPDKKMDFVYKSYQPAQNVKLDIQQPSKATNFATDPATATKTTDPHGFTLYEFTYPTLNAGQVAQVKVSYTKTDPGTSVSALQAQSPPLTPADNATSLLSNPTQVVAVGLIALALALAALGVWYYWSRTRRVPAPATSGDIPRRRATQRGRSATDVSLLERGVDTENASAFCTQCGRALAADDNFCPKCGTPRRRT